MILRETRDPKYDFIFHIKHTDEKGRYIKRQEWEEDPRIERRQKSHSIPQMTKKSGMSLNVPNVAKSILS